jgi:hypothetical protein
VVTVLGSAAWVERLGVASASHEDLGRLQVVAWIDDLVSLPRAKSLLIEEPDDLMAKDEGLILPGDALIPLEKKMLRYLVSVHLVFSEDTPLGLEVEGMTVTVRVQGMITDDRMMTLVVAAMMFPVMVTTIGRVLMIGTGGRVQPVITGAAAVRWVPMTVAASRRPLVSVTPVGPCLALTMHSWLSGRRKINLLTRILPVRLGQGGTQ